MTKDETIRIMAMLGAFYGGGKTDPRVQANAWHLILDKYDYRIAERAVLRYAESDTREYATFPTVGNIVKAIRDEMVAIDKPISEVIKAISYGRPYDMLSTEAQRLISADSYDEWSRIDAMEFVNLVDDLAEMLNGNKQKLLGGA